MTLLSATASVQTAPAAAPTAQDKSSGQSFESYLKASSQQDSQESGTQPLISHKPSSKEHSDKDGEKAKKTDSKKTDTSASQVNLAPVPQAHDPRAFLLALPTGQPVVNSSGSAREDRKASQDAAAGSTLQPPAFDPLAQSETANSASAAAGHAPPKAPIAFSVALPQAGHAQHAPAAAAAASVLPKTTAEPATLSQENKGSSGKQHAESSDSKQPAPAIKSSAVAAAAPKEPVSTPVVNAVPAAASSGTPHYQTPYSTAAPVSNSAATAPTSQVANPAELPQAPTLRPHNIDLKIPGADNSQVDVRVSQRAGDVQVTVRTPDGDLAQSLRQHLPELSDRLAQSGVHGDVWQPSPVKTSSDAGANNSESRHPDDPQAQQQQHQGRNPDGHSQDRRQGQNAHANAAAWLNEARLQEVSSNQISTPEKRSINV